MLYQQLKDIGNMGNKGHLQANGWWASVHYVGQVHCVAYSVSLSYLGRIALHWVAAYLVLV